MAGYSGKGKGKGKAKKPPKRPVLPAQVDGPVPDVISVTDMERYGMWTSHEEERRTTWAERGRVRGGTVGCILGRDISTSQAYAGSCVREGAARYMGAHAPVQKEKHLNSMLMMEQGSAVEGAFIEHLRKGVPEGWTVGDNIQTATEIDGVSWTGREDVFIYDETGEVRQIVELKNVSSFPHELLFDLRPQIKHVVQAANYMHRIGVPVQLLYTSRSVWPVPNWPFVSEPEIDTPYLQGIIDVNKIGKISKLRPFLLGFYLTIVNGRVLYAPDIEGWERGKWIETPITIAGIDEWYRRVIDLAHGTLGGYLDGAPTTVTTVGEPKYYSACDYCDWSSVCAGVGTAASNDREKWVDAIGNHMYKE